MFWNMLDIDHIHYTDFWLVIATAICCDTENSIDLITNRPTLHEIIAEWNLLLTTRCNCLSSLSREEQTQCMTHLSGLHLKMTCENLLHVHSYYLQEHSWPGTTQLMTFIQNIAALHEDMSTYCIEHDMKTPTPHLERLTKKTNLSPKFCSICQSMTTTNMEVYELPCGHVFHCNGPDCLGDDAHTFLHWLESHKTCPT